MEKSDDVETYLEMFEGVSERERLPWDQWAEVIAPFLAPGPMKAYQYLPLEQREDYTIVTDVPFERVAMDLVSPVNKSARGHQHILVDLDYATRYSEAVPLRYTSAKLIAKELMGMFSQTGKKGKQDSKRGLDHDTCAASVLNALLNSKVKLLEKNCDSEMFCGAWERGTRVTEPERNLAVTGPHPPSAEQRALGFDLADYHFILGVHNVLGPRYRWRGTQKCGSRRRNPPERCPRPLCPQDCPEENHNIPEDHQGEDLIGIKVEVIHGAQEAIAIWADQQDGSRRRNPPERCPRPLCPQDCPEENHNIPEDHQEEDPTKNKVKEETEEEVMTRGDQPCVSDGKEEIPGDVSTGNPCENNGLSLNCKKEDIGKHSNGENLITLHGPPGLHSTSLSYNSTTHEEPSPEQSHIVTTIPGHKVDTRFQCDKQLTRSSDVLTQRKHKGKKPYSCSECGKCFTKKSQFVIHERIHTGEKPFSCLECEKSYTDKGSLNRHQRIHTGKKLYSCSECGKCFTYKSKFVIHERIHTAEKPFSCLECAKSFAAKAKFTQERSRFHVLTVRNALQINQVL
ncbi:unnamed protein product [Ranitomeya imitator]|uniref:C2H2-type domain-containing protein n=1 Tax=Ranitomeya imitator TaxID=111125 RepID=A0ABN9M5F1_9NEOB|nr:unnamed protein product [Ranitomeya imitator]